MNIQFDYKLVRWIVQSGCSNGVSITSKVVELESDSTFLEINGTRLVGNYSFSIHGGKHFNAKFTSPELISANNISFGIEWKCTPQSGQKGCIELINYENRQDVHWEIQSDCENILVASQFFATEEYYDYLIIGGVKYSGELNMSQIITKSDFVAYNLYIRNI